MKIYIKIILFALITAMTGCNSSNNNITGLWRITHVQAGDQEMTPVAKWTRISADGTYESGNGWLKSSEGTWSFDDQNKTFLPEETNGLVDPYGAFAVSVDGEEMTWRRDEGGTELVVSLAQIDALPKAPADKVQGLWDLSDVQENGESVINTFDPDNKHYLFIRWDRIFVERTPDGNRQTGYWYMNAHRPELTLMSHVPGTDPQSWTVEISDDDKLQMTGTPDSNRELVKTYSRLDRFPG
ncbi:hypothetical protein [Rhodohalobacter sp. 8-1]|uniref:hypothetical protein n=1 Tax=Rhodohalobacter sp. 8-1 TaxID=3131972 RepID=UPI0030EDCDFD